MGVGRSASVDVGYGVSVGILVTVAMGSATGFGPSMQAVEKKNTAMTENNFDLILLSFKNNICHLMLISLRQEKLKTG